MNKKLVALAVGAIAAGAASAQTANVTLYGSVRLDVESLKYKGEKHRENSLENVSSRFGLRGVESLGGGLNAIFQLESSVTADTGGGDLAGRESWVGLNGGFGTLKLGMGLTPFDDVKGIQDQQSSNSWENVNNGVAGGAGFGKGQLFKKYTDRASTNSSAFDARYGNSVSYETPTFFGFKARTQYALLDEAGNRSTTGWDSALTYNNGPITAGLAYAIHNNFRGLGDIDATFGENDQQALRFSGKFNAGFATVDAAYEMAEYKQTVAKNAQKLKYSYWGVGATVPLGAFTVGIQYGQRDKGLATGDWGTLKANGSYDTTEWSQGGGKHMTAKADYAFSKRTLLRTYYSVLEGEGKGSDKPKVDVFSVGLWHFF